MRLASLFRAPLLSGGACTAHTRAVSCDIRRTRRSLSRLAVVVCGLLATTCQLIAGVGEKSFADGPRETPDAATELHGPASDAGADVSEPPGDAPSTLPDGASNMTDAMIPGDADPPVQPGPDAGPIIVTGEFVSAFVQTGTTQGVSVEGFFSYYSGTPSNAGAIVVQGGFR